tara:strand:+ start:87 stop:530 length:444 start_codon:yes stop_codon:yes gene_type:complete
MKHVHLFEQFINEATWDQGVYGTESYPITDGDLGTAAFNGRQLGRYKSSEAKEIWKKQGTVVSNKNEYSTQKLTDAAYALSEQGVQVKEKQIQKGILVCKEFKYQFTGGQWLATFGNREQAMNIYEFIEATVASKYIWEGDKNYGTK